mgnify:CR=1 FL=1
MSERSNITTREETMPEQSRDIETITPVVDIYENEEEILLHADMPGVSKEDISVNVNNGRLDISGTRNMNVSGAAHWEEFADAEFRRSFSVPQTIDIEKVHAELKEGVLKLHLPKAEAAKSRQIEIKAV